MCFSATASFITGSVLLSAGVMALRKSPSKRSLPFAAIPLLFGTQQIVEGIVWLSFGMPALHAFATYAFVMFSHVLWPVFVPFSIWLIETKPVRKKLLLGVFIIGALVSTYLLACLILGPVTSKIVGHSIAYDIPVPFPFASFALYFFATCAGAMISSSFKIHVFGSAMLLAFFVAHSYYPDTLFSVWCFFAAALSLIIYVHVRDLRKIAEAAKAAVGV